MRGEQEGDCLRPEFLRFFESEFGFLADDRRIQGGRGDVLRGENHAMCCVERRGESISRYVEPVADDARERDLKPRRVDQPLWDRPCCSAPSTSPVTRVRP